MPVEKKTPGSGNIMADALKRAGLGDAKPEQPEAPVASSAPGTQAEKPVPPADRPQPAPRQPQAQQRVAADTTQNVNKDTVTMSQTNQNDFSNDRRKDQHFVTLNDQGARRLRPFSRSAGSVRAKELETAMVKEMNAALLKDNVSEWALQVMDANQLGLPTSALILLQTVKADEIEYVATFSFLIDGPDIRLQPRIEKVEGRPYEIPTVIGDIYNSQDYINRVNELITQARPGRKLQIVDAGGASIPVSFSIEANGVHGLLYKATLATYNTMNNLVELDQAPAYSVANRNSSAEQLVGRLNFTGERYVDETGHPQRHDVIIEVDSSRNQQGREFLTNNNNITKVAGYIEPLYAQPNPDPSQAMNNQPLLAQYVMTHLSSGFDAMDLEMTLQAVASATMVQVNNGWADAFLPRFASANKEVNFRDIGALGYLGADGKKIETKTETFKQNFPAFMREYFRLNQGIVFAIDIPEIGPDAFTMDVFRAAAGNNANAIRALVAAADNLTGGLFTTKANLAGTFPMVVDTGNRIHNGFYVGDQGELRDIRDVDLLAVANTYGKTNPQALITYADSFSMNTGPLAVRMSNRLQIIDDVLNGRQTITGYSGRYIFHPTFLKVLTEACREAGLVVSPANMVHGLGSGAVLGGYDYGAFTAGGAGNSVFGGTSGGGNQQSYGGRGRW